MSQEYWNRASPARGADSHGRKPNKVIPVPLEYRRKTLARERDVFVRDLEVKTGCEVELHWDQGRITQFDLFGSGAGVEKAVRHINQWISNAHVKSREAASWAKTPAFDANKWYYEEIEAMELEHKQKFKGPVPDASEDARQLLRATVDWPEDLSIQSITPRDVFGNKLEALDDAIRLQDEVFVTLLPSRGGLWQIEICGYDDINVDKAEMRLRTMIEKTRIDVNNIRPVLNIILDEKEGIDIVLQEAEPWWPDRTNAIVPRLLSHPMMDTPGDFRQEGMYFSDLSKIQDTIKLALETVRHKKGAYDFVVRLGCLALNSTKIGGNATETRFRKEQFLKDVNDRVDLNVKKWLAHHELGSQILRRLIAEDKFLEPTKSSAYYGYTPKTLKETLPVFRGTWVFRDPNRPGSTSNTAPAPSGPLYVVQVDWTDNEDGMYEKTDSRFYKLEDGKSSPNKNMDINLLELGESRGWQFALESLIGPLAPKIVSPVLTGFAQRVTMKQNYDPSSAEVFAQWDASMPTIKRSLMTGRLDKVYSFGIQKTCYKAELTAMWYPSRKLPVWGLAVRHTEWAIHLAELERLPVGHQAEWGNIVAAFLPDDGQMSCATGDGDAEFGMTDLTLDDDAKAPPRDGIRLLTDKLMQLSDIVSSVVASSDGGVNV
ncbi:hypothetical protein P153DRAFT_336064 [Dothidotthia symphoricarpi CBS 119687]|uniref:DUF7905 domain-containing protein n=1 Tax=Dothidotthia symphoricarpi CBS 119687 TaxID=1392245 RepID=A0A6A6AI55_9PLEO|nr:uncharacterized protein P153DRAFT_336064 [Dothidotthia symphoricarpi CBS 119687]KAF2131619.1 hypothetical protein P153DRAFT_336064 [Dothidotthia symphoricarpi CBS 119687]